MFQKYKMNEINKFLLTVDNFMLEMHLRHSRSTHTACGPFTKNKERIQKFKDTWDSIYIYQNKVDKTFFQHDVGNGDFKDLLRKVLRDKAFKACVCYSLLDF